MGATLLLALAAPLAVGRELGGTDWGTVMANKTHSLKTWPSYWHAVERGDKTFEVRQNDRGFALGDILLLRRWSAVGKTYECQGGTCDREEDAATLKCRVTYILNGAGQHGVQEGWCVLGIQLMWGNIL